MRPRRIVFAADFIQETVEAFEKRVVSCGPESQLAPELEWAGDVLEDYFNVVGSHTTIDMARRQFAGISQLKKQHSTRLTPYVRPLGRSSPVSYADLLALAERRRSVRWFLPERVPRDAIEKAMAVALQSPSACNRQPFVFRFFDDPQMVQKVAEVPMGTAGYGHQLPMIGVVVGQQRNFFDDRDRHLIYIDGALAMMSFCLALETLGLSSCIINWPDIQERETWLAKLIGLESDERPVMLVGVGYPDPNGLVAASSKKSNANAVTFE